MTPRQLTGSRLGLADLCGYWLQPAAPPWPADDGSDLSRFGDGVHDGSASLDRGWKPPDTLPPAEQIRAARCVGHVLDWYEDRAWHGDMLADGAPMLCAEAGFRYSPASGGARRGSARGPDGYDDVQPGEVPLTVDAVVGVGTLDEVTVVEIKTGRAHPEQHAWQVRTAALAVAREVGVDAVTAVLLYVDEDGVRAVVELLDLFDLDEHALRVRELYAALPDRTEPTPGPHCTAGYCPIRTVCPATQAALVRAVPAFPVGEIVNDEQARAVLAALPMADAALDGVKAKLRDYARANPFEVSPGVVYGYREHVGRRVAKLTGERMLALREILGDRASLAVQTVNEAGVGTLEAAARAVAKDRAAVDPTVKLGAETERIMRALVDAGVLVEKEHERCEVFALPKRKGAT